NENYFHEPLETELGYVFRTQEEIEKETRALPTDFEIDDPEDLIVESGAIPPIQDFSEIVCFAISGDGAPFCLDYRADRSRPSVIWWDDIHWRLIAPDFDTFL